MLAILRCLVAGALLPLVAACSQSGSSASDFREAAGAHREGDEGADGSTSAARPRIVFLGDSLTAGYGLAPEESVPSLTQERLEAEGYDYEVVNAGVSGDTSAGGLSRLEWSLDGTVSVLVIELGANDGLRGLPVGPMKRNLGEIIRRAKQRNITVVLTGMEAPPNYGPLYTAEFRNAFRDLADEHEVVFVPFYLEGVAGDPRLNISDGIHPNAAGARIVSQTVWRALEPVLEDVRSAR